MTSFPVPIREIGQTDVLELACDPILIVRMAFIGLGKRGKEAFNNFMFIDGVQIVAICDLFLENTEVIQQVLVENDKEKAKVYFKLNDWRIICESADINLIYVCTQRDLHSQIAVYAMQCGKHVVLEVPAANTIEECWQLVDIAEKNRRHCMMLENCCYDSFQMTILNMVQQSLFGELFHGEGAYIHDLRSLDFIQKPHYKNVWSMHGNPYPTHGLGPLCQLFNIHRGDKLEWLTSVSSGQFGCPSQTSSEKRKEFCLGNINTTLIRTIKDKTIVLQHDISSPRPYSRNFLVSGTEGFVEKRTIPKIYVSSSSNEFLTNEKTDKLLKEYEHPFFQKKGELAEKVGTHGGMNFIMDYRLIYCLQNGLPLDMDVYDAAEWSCIVELSAQSVKNGSIPVKIPDFTRGSWNKLKKLQFFYKRTNLLI